MESPIIFCKEDISEFKRYKLKRDLKSYKLPKPTCTCCSRLYSLLVAARSRCSKMLYLVLLVFSLGALFHTIQGQNCFDDQGDAQFCAPPFLDPSFDKPVDATNTCGLSGPTEYCPLLASRCQICDAQAPRSRHPASYITDQFGYFNPTWWQSGTMFDGVGYPVAVNLTFDFSKYAQSSKEHLLVVLIIKFSLSTLYSTFISIIFYLSFALYT